MKEDATIALDAGVGSAAGGTYRPKGTPKSLYVSCSITVLLMMLDGSRAWTSFTATGAVIVAAMISVTVLRDLTTRSFRLTVGPGGVTWRGLFRTRRLRADEVEEIRWPVFLSGSEVFVRDGSRCQPIILSQYPAEAQREIAAALRTMIPLARQYGWESFARRLTPEDRERLATSPYDADASAFAGQPAVERIA